jgi:hypothetical protein
VSLQTFCLLNVCEKKSCSSSFFRKCTVFSTRLLTLLCLWLWNLIFLPSIICLSVWCYSLFKLLQSLPTTQHIYELSLNSSCPMFVTTCSTEFWKWKKGQSFIVTSLIDLKRATMRREKMIMWTSSSTFKSDLFEATKIRIILNYSIYSPKKFDILQLYIKFVLWTNKERKITTPTQSL